MKVSENLSAIVASNLDDFALGASLLGSGGGGDPYLGKLLAKQALSQVGRVRLANIHEFDDDALVTMIGFIGVPTIFSEKISINEKCFQAVDYLQEKTGKKIAAFVAGEIGGVNSLSPILTAASYNLPVIDADMTGRALPHVNMITPNIYNVPIGPAVFANEKGRYEFLEVDDMKALEHEARRITMQMGGVCFACLGLMTIKSIREVAIAGTVNAAIQLGNSIHQARYLMHDPVQHVKSFFQSSLYGAAKILFDGKIVDLYRRERSGFVRGHVHLQSLRGDDEMEVMFQNEYLLANINHCAVATVPDLICILDRETAEPITVEALRYGQRVKVLAVRAPPMMRTAQALNVVGPQVFGFDAPYYAVGDD